MTTSKAKAVAWESWCPLKNTPLIPSLRPVIYYVNDPSTFRLLPHVRLTYLRTCIRSSSMKEKRMHTYNNASLYSLYAFIMDCNLGK